MADIVKRWDIDSRNLAKLSQRCTIAHIAPDRGIPPGIVFAKVDQFVLDRDGSIFDGGHDRILALSGGLLGGEDV